MIRRPLWLAVLLLPACVSPVPEGPEPEPTLDAGAAQAPPPAETPVGILCELGPEGRLRSREIRIAEGSTTRARAEYLVRRLVEESGLFPENTRILDVFVSGRGVAVVNFSRDLLRGHPGGLFAEELTVYGLSHSLVASFPAIAEVRLVVEGRSPRTLAGHLDLDAGFGLAPDRLLEES